MNEIESEKSAAHSYCYKLLEPPNSPLDHPKTEFHFLCTEEY